MIYSLYRLVNENLELGFYIQTSGPLSDEELAKIYWLVAETFEPLKTDWTQHYMAEQVVEIGPRLSIETSFSSNAVSICRSMGLAQVTRIEQTRRYLITPEQTVDRILGISLSEKDFDRMTEQHYPNGIETFDTGTVPEPVRNIDLIREGMEALVAVNKSLGLAMDDRDLTYYYDLFVRGMIRNPTDVELSQLANANSEHGRHWYWNGIMIIDGVTATQTLMDIVKAPLKALGPNNRTLKAFNDNAGVLRGFAGVEMLLPILSGQPSEFMLEMLMVHLTCTAETHNHPTKVSPFAGAQTGAGGRIRDNVAVGRGAYTLASVAGYLVGNLFVPGYEIPGEDEGKDKPSTYASPLQILIEGSNGVSSYGNEYGEPLLMGFTRSYGQRVLGEWIEARKPILYSGGIGQMFDLHLAKEEPKVGMLIVRIGGPAYPIAVGGGSASSTMPGQITEALEYKSVQRGNPEIKRRVNRAIRAFIELRMKNPIASIHDQGSGGLSNLLPELMAPLGGIIDLSKVVLGDITMSDLEIWVAEYQEGYGVLIWADQLEVFQSICVRERVNCEVLGKIDGSGKIVVINPKTGQTPVNLDLEKILTKMPPKTFTSTRRLDRLPELLLPQGPIGPMIHKVFQQLAVGSKGFLVHKVDRSVGGLTVQQQCCGVAQIAIANVGIVAQSHFGLTGVAFAIGENPIRMLIDPRAGARMVIGEMLTNLASARITSLGDIRGRSNVMWAAKMPHEGARLNDAVAATSELMLALGIAVDGGKDSLSMVDKIAGEFVKSPGSLVFLGYAPVADITKRVTPDIKNPGATSLALIDLGLGKNRLGGSALAQAYSQLGNESPDVDDPQLLKNAFLAVQQMIDEGLILALHDRSDGGLITAVTEMCMASHCGFTLNMQFESKIVERLFSEELGFVIELRPEDKVRMQSICSRCNVPFSIIGNTSAKDDCVITTGFGQSWNAKILELRAWWEVTSSKIEELQMNPVCAQEEYREQTRVRPSIGQGRQTPSYQLTFTPKATPYDILTASNKPKVAIIIEEGTNGDREMIAACMAAGFAPWEVTMSDLLAGTITLDRFQGIIFAGGFSYMDVFGSAKGWAGTILFNRRLRDMFDCFFARRDTFSLGVCNGCQLMALLGIVPWRGIDSIKQPRFIHNTSGRFESRWAQVKILPSPSILFRGMEGSKLGVWVAHGEGRLIYPDALIAQEVKDYMLTPLAYVDPNGYLTEQYPYNPNGSPGGATGLCSRDGRHTAIMPHPERAFRLWQWPYLPAEWKALEASPWLRMFQNARAWCVEHREQV